MPQTKPVLQVNDLVIAFDEVVVAGVSFDVFPGKTTAIVGESGSGKTVTSTAIMGLLPSSGRVVSGEVRGVNGEVWIDADGAPRTPMGRDISMVFQDPMSSLNPSMKVGKQVAEPLQIHLGMSKMEARKKVIELFKEVELPEPETSIDKYPHELSGGQKQRVMIAMALACNPKILVADEPTTALDVTVQATVLQLLRRLQKERNLGILFITHDLDVVRDIADFIVVMRKGEVVEKGDCPEVLDSPENAYTKELIASRPQRVGKEVEVKDDVISEGRDLVLKYAVKQNLFGKVVSEFVAVNRVNLKIRNGERVGLVGESGCGKSTLGRLMLGLESPTEGVVFWKGEELDLGDRQGMKAFRRGAQPVFQDPFSALNPRMTIGNALSEAIGMSADGSKLTRAAKTKIAGELLEEVGLMASDLSRYPGAFSGGMRQRIVLARALAVKPELLILDESVAALDLRIQAQILTLLSDIQKKRSLAYLFISHDLGVIHSVCDRILVMKDGEIVEEGSANTIFNSPSNSYTKHLLASRPGMGKLTV
ncbi:MAG TPA: ABC transporter ATP-binding protein [Flavobacteriales bacterium]|jgi:ABC-type microcin C transport system duplicated ATPase subunit YejF|nr:ABC transporter ATP-binding protein [Flavobacteriales bacterium]